MTGALPGTQDDRADDEPFPPQQVKMFGPPLKDKNFFKHCNYKGTSDDLGEAYEIVSIKLQSIKLNMIISLSTMCESVSVMGGGGLGGCRVS